MLTLAFAQTCSAPSGGTANSLIGLMPIAIIFVIFYFLLIRPQKKNQKEHAQMLSNLSKNDEVVTAGGMYGIIVNIQNDVVTLRVDDNTRIKVQKSSISKFKNPKAEEKK